MRPVILTERCALLCGDSRALDLGEGSVDAVVCDPPYELGFMGKRWDATGIAYDVDLWRAVYRALKPGGHLLAFGGSRTYHRMACAIEDAGFEVRDSLHWVYGSGFPKSKNVSKAIDERLGATRPIVGPNPNSQPNMVGVEAVVLQRRADAPLTTAGSPEAAAWDGWGTALKPAHEPIILARKPLSDSANGKMTVAECVLAHGTGAINVDGCRIGRASDDVSGWSQTGSEESENHAMSGKNYARAPKADADGRWPANFLLSHLDECELVGVREARRNVVGNVDGTYDREGTVLDAGLKQKRAVVTTTTTTTTDYRCASGCPVGELGESARFYYCAKPRNRERDFGCEALPARTGGEATDRADGSAGLNSPRAGAGRRGGRRNVHPTVKPIDLMRWLCRLVTPRGGVVLDPFTGSGTTGIAAIREGLRFVGVEQSDEYIEIARARIARALEES